MARENQGLQIALIVFVMLTIVLGVTTFLFYRQYDEADAKAKQNETKAKDAQTEVSNREADIKDLKEIIDSRDAELAAVTEKSNKDREPYKKLEKDAADKLPSYHKVIQHLSKTNGDLQANLDKAQDELKKFKAEYKTRVATMTPQVEQAEQARDKARTDLATEQTQFKKDRDAFKKQQDEVAELLDKARKDGAAQLTKVEGNLKSTEKRLAELAEQNQENVKYIATTRQETITTFCGQVSWVNQRNNTVWINLGRADGLSRQTTFSVYAADAIDLSKGGKKASIEVTQIQGEHTAEARIVEDKISDPIMPGDKIFSPVWSPGQRRHFALVGFMDLDGDGRSDLEAVRNLITMNGGVVDYVLDESGEQGAMSVNTRYLVKGDPPNVKGAAADKKIEEYLKDYGKALKRAESLGVQTLLLDELLQRMGWKQPSSLIRLGRGGAASGPSTKAPEETGKAPGGGAKAPAGGAKTPAGAFKPRTPPKVGAGGAYPAP